MNIKASDNQFPRVLWDSATSDDTTPAAGMISVYVKADGQIYGKNSADAEKLLIAATIGTPFPPAGNDILLALNWSAETGYDFVNAPFATLVANQLIGALAAFPGFAASKRLAVNVTADGFEWVDP